jgi:hypothetical protein
LNAASQNISLAEVSAHRRRQRLCDKRYQLNTQVFGPLSCVADDAAASVLDDYPCASVKEVCCRLGIKQDIMDRHAPELRSRIARTHREWRRINTVRRHKQLHEDVRLIAFELVRDGIYTSMRRILKLLTPGHLANWKVYNEAFLEARKALADAGETDWMRTAEQF